MGNSRISTPKEKEIFGLCKQAGPAATFVPALTLTTMKPVFVLLVCLLVVFDVCAQQVEINKSILLSGTVEADRRIVNLGTPIQIYDAANAQAIQSGKLCFATATGSNNAFNLTLTPAATQYVTGMVVNFKAPTSTTGNVTLNLNSLGAKSLLKSSGATLVTSDIIQGQMVCAAYDGNTFQLLTPVSGLVLPQNGVDYDSFTYKVGFDNASTYTWTVPANVTTIMVEVWGAGGGGGSAGCSSGTCSSYPAGGFGGGGGAGGYGRELLAVTPGITFSITVGAGGLGISTTTCGQNGGAGGTTSFGSLVSATGGQGGRTGQYRSICSGSVPSGAGGTGGTSAASVSLTGASGAFTYIGGSTFVSIIVPPTVPLYLQNYVGTFKTLNPVRPAPGGNGNSPNPTGTGGSNFQADGQPGFVLISY